MTQHSDRYASLCSGIGGLDLAVEQVFGLHPVWHAEIELDAAMIHDRHWPDLPNVGDITAADWSELEHVALLCAGYPCQPFSAAGARRGEEDDRHLWPHIAEAVRVLRPRWVVLENVAGHLSLGFGTVLGDLAEAGYDAEWVCLPASEVGAPHRRERIFVLAADASGERRHHGGDPDGLDAVPGAQERSPAQDQQQRDRRFGGALKDDCPTANSDGGRLEVGLQLDCDPLSPTANGGSRWGHPDGRCEAPTDSECEGLERTARTWLERSGEPSTGGTSPWGAYEPAIERWGRVLGRPAPDPVDGRGRLNPPFVEWMMGYPAGWVDGLKRTAALRCLGNAVVPLQAIAALSVVLESWREAA